MVKIGADLEAPWAPHVGLQLCIEVRKLHELVWKLRKPADMPTFLGPSLKTWGEAIKKNPPKASSALGPPVCKQHHSQELSLEYSVFSQAAEEYLLCKGTLGPAEKKQHQGRGEAIFDWVPLQPPNRVGAIFSAGDACFWSALASRLEEASKVKSKSGEGPVHQARLESWLERAAARGRERLSSLPLSSKVEGQRPLRSAAEEVLGQLSGPSQVKDLPVLKVKVLSKLARRAATYLQKQLQQKAKKEWKAWVSKAVAGGAGVGAQPAANP
jgi:hypothetical protein